MKLLNIILILLAGNYLALTGVQPNSVDLDVNLQKSYRCLTCSAMFSTVRLRNQHFNNSCKNDFTTCVYCNETDFKNKASCNHHESYCQKNPNRKAFTCTACDKKYITKSNLSRHTKSAHPDPTKVSTPKALSKRKKTTPVIMEKTALRIIQTHEITEQEFQGFFK